MNGPRETANSISVAIRCVSALVSFACLGCVVFAWECPRYAFGMSDDQTAAMLGSVLFSAALLGLGNAIGALLARYFMKEMRGSVILLVAVFVPLFVLLFAPAIQTA